MVACVAISFMLLSCFSGFCSSEIASECYVCSVDFGAQCALISCSFQYLSVPHWWGVSGSVLEYILLVSGVSPQFRHGLLGAGMPMIIIWSIDGWPCASHLSLM